MRLLPLVHGKESRSAPEVVVPSGIRNARRSDIDASRRTRLAGPDPEFAVLVSHPSFGPPFPEKLDLRSHRITSRRPGTRAASCGALKRRRPAFFTRQLLFASLTCELH